MTKYGYYLPFVVFVGFSLRLIALGSGIGEALALFAFSGLYGFNLFLEYKKNKDGDTSKIDVEYLKQQVATINTNLQLSKVNLRAR